MKADKECGGNHNTNWNTIYRYTLTEQEQGSTLTQPYDILTIRLSCSTFS